MQTLRSIIRRDPEGPVPRPRWQLYLLSALAIVVVLGLTLAGFTLARPGVLPGTTLDGLPVGGLDRVALAEVVASYTERTNNETISIKAVTGSGADKRLDYTRKDLGFTVDEAATVELVWRRGRQLNPVLALADHLRALGGGVEIRPASTLDDNAFERWVASATAEFDSNPIEAELEISGATVSFREAEPGMAVDRAVLAERARDALEAPGPHEVEVPAEELLPEGDPEELAQVARQAEIAVSGPVRLTRGEAALEFSGEEIGHLLSIADEGGRPLLHVDPAALDAAVEAEQREALESDPVNARVRLSGGAVVIDPAEQGFRFDAEAAARQVLEVATSEPSDGQAPRQAEFVGETLEPDFTTADAEALRIVERVSSFTTEFPAGQSRVQNIHRMADLVAGVVLRPGERFSINEHVGPRTRERGFTEGGVIIDGEFETAIGGGVSQFATTFFNAAYFGGYEILEHRPHSYYISRYPEGRESTLNYPDIDVVIRNDSPHGLLIATSYSSTSVTVEMWGSEWVDVESVTSERRNIQEPHIVVRENHRLAPGQTRVVQSGRLGFTVSYTRTLSYHDGRHDEHTWTHTYRAEPRIVERNTSAATATPTTTTGAASGGTRGE